MPVEAVAAHGATLRSAWVRTGPPPLLVVGADVVVDATGSLPRGGGRRRRARRGRPRPAGPTIVGRALPQGPPSLGLPTTAPTPAPCVGSWPGAAPPGASGPRTVVVTGPPGEPGFVENAYLATQLGYNVAESADVVVRGGRAWLRSLEGLEPVDVLLRRVPDTDLDPVEDDRGGRGGVAGVVEAVRHRRVAMVNPHGAGMAASLALQPFLDAARGSWTGHPLRLGASPPVWCGDPDARAAVPGGPRALGPPRHRPRAAGAVLRRAPSHDADVAAWPRPGHRCPRAVTGPGGDPLAGAPRLVGGGLRPCPCRCGPRSSSASTAGRWCCRAGTPGWWTGSRSRPARPAPEGRVGPGPRAAGADRGRAPAMPQVDLRRSLPTRAAEAMYWTGRTAERAEMAARTVLAVLARLGSHPDAADVAAVGRRCGAVSGGWRLGLGDGPRRPRRRGPRTLAGRPVVGGGQPAGRGARPLRPPAPVGRDVAPAGHAGRGGRGAGQAGRQPGPCGRPQPGHLRRHRGAGPRADAPGGPVGPGPRERGPRAGLAVPGHRDGASSGRCWCSACWRRCSSRSSAAPRPPCEALAWRPPSGSSPTAGAPPQRRHPRALGDMLLADRDNPRSVQFQLDQLVRGPPRPARPLGPPAADGRRPRGPAGARDATCPWPPPRARPGPRAPDPVGRLVLAAGSRSSRRAT